MCNRRDPFLKEYVIKDDATADRLIRAMEHPVDLMEKFTYHPKEERKTFGRVSRSSKRKILRDPVGIGFTPLPIYLLLDFYSAHIPS